MNNVNFSNSLCTLGISYRLGSSPHPVSRPGIEPTLMFIEKNPGSELFQSRNHKPGLILPCCCLKDLRHLTATLLHTRLPGQLCNPMDLAESRAWDHVIVSSLEITFKEMCFLPKLAFSVQAKPCANWLLIFMGFCSDLWSPARAGRQENTPISASKGR